MYSVGCHSLPSHRSAQRDEGGSGPFFPWGQRSLHRAAALNSVEVIRSFQDRQVEAGTFGAEFGRAWEGQVTRSESIVRGRLWYVQKFGLHAAGRREPVQGFKLWQNGIRFSFLKVTPVTTQGKKWLTYTFFRPCLQNPERTNIPFSSRLP